MLACVDVDYRRDATVTGCVLFQSWSDACATGQVLTTQAAAQPYKPGEFYLRELPPIQAVLSQVKVPIETVVVDGYVWLNSSRMGLGAHLFFAHGQVPVIGVAKNPWHREEHEQEVNHPERRTIAITRGASKRLLYITSAGIDVALAAKLIAGMHGRFRIPTLLAAVDRLVRSTP